MAASVSHRFCRRPSSSAREGVVVSAGMLNTGCGRSYREQIMTFVSRRRGGLAAVVFLAICGVIAAADPVRYDNHKLVEVALKTPADLQRMLAISEDHWSCSVGLGII